MNVKRDKNTRKPAKGGNSTKSGQKSSRSAKKRQSNAGDSRASSGRVTTCETPTEDHINSTLKRMQQNDHLRNLRAKPIKIEQNTSAWVRLMAQKGVTRTTLVNCMNITRTTYRQALEYPSKYLTLHDLFFLAGITGVSVGEQIELLYYGSAVGQSSEKSIYKSSRRSNPSDLSSLVSED